MTALVMLACFMALPLGVLVGYRAGYKAAQQSFLDAQAREWNLMRSRVQSQLLRARPAADPTTRANGNLH